MKRTFPNVCFLNKVGKAILDHMIPSMSVEGSCPTGNGTDPQGKALIAQHTKTYQIFFELYSATISGKGPPTCIWLQDWHECSEKIGGKGSSLENAIMFNGWKSDLSPYLTDTLGTMIKSLLTTCSYKQLSSHGSGLIPCYSSFLGILIYAWASLRWGVNGHTFLLHKAGRQGFLHNPQDGASSWLCMSFWNYFVINYPFSLGIF